MVGRCRKREDESLACNQVKTNRVVIAAVVIGGMDDEGEEIPALVIESA